MDGTILWESNYLNGSIPHFESACRGQDKAPIRSWRIGAPSMWLLLGDVGGVACLNRGLGLRIGAGGRQCAA